MPTDIIMPQMGESIVEGTITKWLKKPGDKVQRDEPLFEISTDKVDAEIPAPASGVLREIKVTEGTTVGVNTIVGTISVDGEAAAAPAKTAVAGPPAKEETKEEKKTVTSATPQATDTAPPPQETFDDEDARSSPLVRKIAREHGVSLSQISGTGLGGRITKQDIMAFVERQGSQAARERTDAFVRPAERSDAQQSALPASTAPQPAPRPTPVAYPGDLVPLTNMRKIIAQRMIESRRTSAHVHCMYEVDFTRIVSLRAKHKNGFEQRHGVRLTFMPFFVRAAI
ncbi:MAG TPA: biotin/lipoyl-containing protein, partial [Candidatus Sulfotelmatobacter sp.]|nr:biotin/lipoyl-containing protein [Candidatus Sulfotelmatobacter sp.]